MAAAQYEIHDLDHLGLPARQVTINCQHGETTRVFVRERGKPGFRDRVLLREAADEHEATYGCGCVTTMRRQPRSRR